MYSKGYKRSIFLFTEKGGVNCGNHIAPKCEDCILDIGPDGCLDNGDCFWNKTTSTCTKKGTFIFHQFQIGYIRSLLLNEYIS